MSYYVCPEHGVDTTDLDMDSGEMFCWKCERTEDELKKVETLDEARDA